jgi:transposase
VKLTPPVSPQQQALALQQALGRQQLRYERQSEELRQAREQLRIERENNARLEQRVTDLEMRVRRDSTTSSAPPSSDRPWDKEARRKARNKRKAQAGKNKDRGGGRHGHRGQRRSVVQPDTIERHLPMQCAQCGASLQGQPARPAGRRQVTELSPLEPKVTEHRLYSVRCGLCGHRTRAPLPAGVRHGGSFGPRLRALMALLRGAYGLSLRKVCTLLWEVFGVKVSHGALSHNEARVSTLLEGNYLMIDGWLNAAARLFVDETSWWQAYGLVWLWVKSDGKARCYQVKPRRNTQTAMEFLATFEGLLTTDELASYNGYDERKRQLCLGHLQRRIRQLGLDPAMKAWAHGVDDAFDTMFATWQRIRDGTLRWEQRRVQMHEPQQRLQALFAQGCSHEHPRVRNLCSRVLRQWKLWWRFVVVGSEPTNNEAERSLRPAVLMRRISHGSRSDRGSRFFERMMTVVQTLRGYGEAVFDFLTRTMQHGAQGQSLPLVPLGD